MKYSYQIDNETYTVELIKTSEGYRAVLNGQEFPVRVIKAREGELDFQIGDQQKRAYWAFDGQRRWVCFEGKTIVLTSNTPGSGRKPKASARDHSAEKTIRAPMPGNVRAVQVSEGETVTKGQTLIILEAMKMEIRVQAPVSGKLARLTVRMGEQVERDQILGEMA